jgi:hypothetical protein
VGFAGTTGVQPTPVIDAGTPAGRTRRVRYQELWPGITLEFTLNAKGVCEAIYRLAPGAAAESIRLRYSVAPQLQPDGQLIFRFPQGQFSESSPEAWQNVEGRRVKVAVAFTVSNGEVGFSVGNYDRRYPLTIDPSFGAMPEPGQGRR